ncbi:MAG: hypothetical protein PHH82_00475 [Candidatus ainarchaeum sp.]|nr:hypothetical protein [Candidatus ainarchaeum sp.]
MFSLDLVFAVVLFVLLFGILYQTFSYSLHQYNSLKTNVELSSYLDLIENKFVLSKDFSCDLVTQDDVVIKQIAYCIDTSKFNRNLLALPPALKLSIPELNINDTIEMEFAKKFKVILHNGPVKKADYYNCVMGAECKLVESELTIGVGYQ